MNEEILDLIDLHVSTQLMTIWVRNLLLLCTASTAVSGTIYKLILQRAVCLISYNALSLSSGHQWCIVARVVSSRTSHHHQILSLVLSAAQLRPWPRGRIGHAIPNVLDRLIHISCGLLAALLRRYYLDSISTGYGSIRMNATWEKWLVHLLHKCIE